MNKMHKLKWGKTQKLDFYTDSMVLFACMKICFVRKVDGFYHKKNLKKN